MAAEAIKALITKTANATASEQAEMATDIRTMIRPSGNPLNAEQLKAMYTSGDITDYSGKLVSIDLVRVNGNMAYAVWKWHQIFNYKGTPNNDISTVTSVFEKNGDTWEEVHTHRSQGKPPPGDDKK